MLLLNEYHPDHGKDTDVEKHKKNLTDVIPFEESRTLGGALVQRIRRTPEGLAYRQYDPAKSTWIDTSWSQMGRETARWRAALQSEGLKPGERIAVMLRNCREWACFDLAAQSLGLVTVPLYTNDRPANVAYILKHSGSRLLLLEGAEDWLDLKAAVQTTAGLHRVLSVHPIDDADYAPTCISDWLPGTAGEFHIDELDPDALATIVYTSGTTGRPKGVMLSHRNMLWDINSGLDSIDVFPSDLFLSFLPLSHTLERSIGFYLPIVAGAGVAYARSIEELAEDLQNIKPTILISVPRIFERVYRKLKDKIEAGPGVARGLFDQAVKTGWERFLHQQGRAPWTAGQALWPVLDTLVAHKVRDRLGGRLRFAICGGAALSADIARLFIGLGIPVAQGYGLTEFSPVAAVNPLEDNLPESVGTPLKGVEVRIGAQDELQIRGHAVMLGYWKDQEATDQAIDNEGWLHTGDRVRMEKGHIIITGRLKEIIVLSNGEKVPPGEMEMALALDPLFEQVIIIGEGRPYLSALVVPGADAYAGLLEQLKLPPDTGYEHPKVQAAVLERAAAQLHDFPGFAKILRVELMGEPWTIDNGLMTPTMKLRRSRILEHHADAVNGLYRGH